MPEDLPPHEEAARAVAGFVSAEDAARLVLCDTCRHNAIEAAKTAQEAAKTAQRDAEYTEYTDLS